MHAPGGTRDFFLAQHQAFDQTLRQHCQRGDLVRALLSQAFSSFEGNVAVQSEGQPPIDCSRGCCSCCMLRVSATAPEILLIAWYLRQLRQARPELGAALEQALRQADSITRGMSEAKRAGLRRLCPFIHQGACAIYPVRPLACRGLACHDRTQCAAASLGRAGSIPYSEPHRLVRSLVQNALQCALRDHGLHWGSYELNHALVLALGDEQAEPAWQNGADPIAEAAVHDIPDDEMAQVFDQLLQRAPPTPSRPN